MNALKVNPVANWGVMRRGGPEGLSLAICFRAKPRKGFCCIDA
jgi:hypothetical protein